MAVVGVPPTHRPGPLQSLRGDLVAPSPGQAPLPVPYAMAGGSVTEIATGFSAIVTDVSAAAKEIKDTVSTLALQMDKLVMFSEHQRRTSAVLDRETLVSAFQEAFLTTAAAVVTVANGGASSGAGAPAGAPGLPYGQQGGVGPFGESPASRGQVPTTEEMRGGIPAGRGGVQTYEQARGTFGGLGMKAGQGPRVDPFGIRSGLDQQGFDVGGIRQRIAGSIQRGLSSAQFGPDLAQDEQGVFRWRAGAEGGRGGEFASQDEIRSFQRSQKLQDVVGSIGESGFARGIATALPRAGAVLGVAGAGIGAAWAASELYADQREQNAAFQRITGGSNLDAMRERGKQQVFGFQQRFGGMGAGQASELYGGLVGIDEQSNGGRFNRAEALRFGQNNYSRMGMTAQESIALVNIAAENGETSLNALADALKRVTDSAREAGVDADVAREKFTSYYQTAIASGAGRSAAATAGTLASMQASLGPGFQSANLGGMVSGNPAQMIQQARAVGMDWTSYQNALSTSEGSALQARAQTAQLRQLSASMLGPQGLSRVRQYAQQQFGNNDTAVSDVTATQWEELQQAANINPYIAKQQIEAMMPGVQVTGEQAVRMIAGVQAGIVNPEAEQAAAVQESAIRSLTDEERQEAETGNVNALEDRIGGWGVSKFASGNTQRRHKARKEYVDWAADTGMSSPIVERLLKNHDDSRRFRVQSQDGARIVNLREAMDSYMDQIASGAAEIVEGSGTGQTVAEWAGMEQADASQLGDSAATQGKGKKDAKGKSAEEWEREAKGGQQVRVIIEPDAALQGFIRASVPGSANATVDSARNSGTAPPRTTDPVTRHQPGDG